MRVGVLGEGWVFWDDGGRISLTIAVFAVNEFAATGTSTLIFN